MLALRNISSIISDYQRTTRGGLTDEMATIKEIAKKLGISVGTVSKGLNGAKDISDDLRKKVLNTAVELGYKKRIQKQKKDVLPCLLRTWALMSLKISATRSHPDLKRLPLLTALMFQ